MNINKTILTLGVLAVAAVSSAQQMEMKKPLIERLGGIHKIAALVDETISMFPMDERLMANQKIAMAIKNNSPSIKFQLTTYFAMAAGGKQTYVREYMQAAHMGMNITEEQWMAANEVFQKVAEKHMIPEAEQMELATAAMKLKDDVVAASWKPANGKMMMPMVKGVKAESLYVRLGGIDAIAAVVDDFVNNLAMDPTIGANPNVVKALTSGKVTGAGLKYLVTEQLASAAGGPYKYSGRDMKSSHAGLMVTEAEWQAGAKILQKTLDKFKVPSREQREIFAVIESTKKDIVGG